MLDTSIPLGYKSPAIESPLTAYSQALGVQNQQQSLQAGAQKLQSNDLELKQQQRASDYQKTFSDAIQKHTTKNPDGTLSTDWGGIQGDVTNAGFGPEAIAINSQIAAAHKTALDNMKLQNEVDGQRIQRVGAAAQSLIGIVDPTETDPNKQSVQKAAFASAVPGTVDHLVQMGDLSPQVGAQIKAQIATTGYTPQIASFLQQQAGEAMTAQQGKEHVDKLIDQAREAKTADSVVTKNAAETAKANVDTSKATADLADKAKADLAVAASQATTLADYHAALAKDLKTAAAMTLPDLTDADFAPGKIAATQERINRAGLTAEQLSVRQNNQDQRGFTAGENAKNRAARLTAAQVASGMVPDAPLKPGDNGLKDGKGALPSIATVDAFRRAAGGDKAKTKELLQQYHWSLQ